MLDDLIKVMGCDALNQLQKEGRDDDTVEWYKPALQQYYYYYTLIITKTAAMT